MITRIIMMASAISAIVVVMMMIMMPSAPPAVVYAQLQQSQPQQGGAGGEVFESEDDGFMLQVPRGWVIQDVDNEPLGPYSEGIAVLCLENEALPAIAGGYNCEAADLTDSIQIERWPNLQSIPEFENITSSNYTITKTICLHYEFSTYITTAAPLK